MTTDVPATKRTEYRKWMTRSMGLGAAGFIVATAIAVIVSEGTDDLFLFAGVGVYYFGVVGYLAIWQRTGARLFDEREAQIERRAGQLVAHIVTFAAIFGLPADVVLSVTGLVDIPPVIRGMVWGYFALVLVYLLVYAYVERQHT